MYHQLLPTGPYSAVWSSTVTITVALLKLCLLVWCEQGHGDNTCTLDNQGVCVCEGEGANIPCPLNHSVVLVYVLRCA